jgi:hypothetical protein
MLLCACSDEQLVVVIEREREPGGASTVMGCEDLLAPAFCESFDEPSPGGRAGDLDDGRFSVARISNLVNQGQGHTSDWAPATASACGTERSGVLPPDDLFFCTNPRTGRRQLNDVINDQGHPTWHAIRVRQPFDFANDARIVLELEAKQRMLAGKGHWWAVAISADAAPAPYLDFIGQATRPESVLVFDFGPSACAADTGRFGQLTGVWLATDHGRATRLDTGSDEHECFAVGDEIMNHVEIRLLGTVLEVWATDLDDNSTLRRVAQVKDVALPFSRGYVNLIFAKYNGSEVGLPTEVTFHLGAVGFDGPTLPTPRAYPLPDAQTPPGGSSEPDHLNLGYLLDEDGIATCCDWTGFPGFELKGLELGGARAARLNFTAYDFTEGESLFFRFNGGTFRESPHAYPDSSAGVRAITIPVPLADLRPGPNRLELRASRPVFLVNGELEIELQ